MNPHIFRVLLLVVLAFFHASAANAAQLILDFSGEFTHFTTLGGTALDFPTPFTVRAVFDSTSDLDPTNGIGIFPAVVTFDIDGHSYTSAPGADVNVYLLIESARKFVGLSSSTAVPAYFGWYFGTATPSFNPDAPEPLLLTGTSVGSGHLPFTIPLAGGAGDLALTSDNALLGNATTSAEITAIPEPGTLMLSLLAAAVCGAGFRRRARVH